MTLQVKRNPELNSGFFSAAAVCLIEQLGLMRLEAKRFIPFEIPNDPDLDQHGFTAGETAQHVEYPEHCNVPTVIRVNPHTHTLVVQMVEVNGKSELQVTLMPMDENL